MVCARCAKVISDGLWYIAVRVCVYVVCLMSCLTNSLPYTLFSPRFNFRKKIFRHKFSYLHTPRNTHLSSNTYIHKHRKKKRNKQRAREILHLSVAMNSTPLPTSREYVLYVLTCFWFFFFWIVHSSPHCIFVSVSSRVYDVLTNFFSLINRNNNNGGVTIEGEDITQTISFQTPVVGGSNNNSSRVPLHSVVVRFFFFFEFWTPPPLFWVSLPLPRQSQKKKWRNWQNAFILCATIIIQNRTNRRR